MIHKIINYVTAKWAFRTSVRMKMWRYFYRPLRLGIPLNDVLTDALVRERRKKNSPLIPILTKIQDKFTNQGTPFSTAVQKYVSSNEYILFLSGEKRSDTLPEVFNLVVNFLSSIIRIKNNLIAQTIYPVFLFAMVCLLLWSFGAFIVPQLATAVDPAKWTGAGAVIYSLSQITASSYFLFLILAIILAFILFTISLTQLTGNIRLILDKIPPWSWYKDITGAIFIYTLATLVRSGMTINDSLVELSEKEDMSPYLLERIKAIRKQYKEGNYLSVVMRSTGMDFPSKELIEEIESFEKYSSNLHKILYELGQEWLSDSEKKFYTKIVLIKYLMFFLVFALILLMIAGFFSVQSSMLIN